MKFLASLLLANSAFAYVQEATSVNLDAISDSEVSDLWDYLELLDGYDDYIMESTWRDYIDKVECFGNWLNYCDFFEKTTKPGMV